MPDNTILNPGVSGDTIRDVLKGSAKTQVVILDYGGDGGEDIAPRPYGSGVVTSETPRVVIASTVLTPSAPDAASVDDAASGQVVAANASRKGLILVNTSSARISLGFESDAVLDSGVTLYPGGTFNMSEFDFTIGAVNAIASIAASNLSIQEYTS